MSVKAAGADWATLKQEVRIGDQKISKIYSGNTLIYPKKEEDDYNELLKYAAWLEFNTPVCIYDDVYINRFGYYVRFGSQEDEARVNKIAMYRRNDVNRKFDDISVGLRYNVIVKDYNYYRSGIFISCNEPFKNIPKAKGSMSLDDHIMYNQSGSYWDCSYYNHDYVREKDFYFRTINNRYGVTPFHDAGNKLLDGIYDSEGGHTGSNLNNVCFFDITQDTRNLDTYDYLLFEKTCLDWIFS